MRISRNVGTGDLPGDYPATDDPVVGGGDDTYVPPQPGTDPGTDAGNNGDGGGVFGCSLSHGNTARDPLLPALVLLALGYLGLRRRMDKAVR